MYMQIEFTMMMKRTSVHITPRAIPCTATYEAASPVEVWSLCSLGSTCTETVGVDMIWSMLIIIGIYALIIGLLIMWDKEKLK